MSSPDNTREEPTYDHAAYEVRWEALVDRMIELMDDHVLNRIIDDITLYDELCDKDHPQDSMYWAMRHLVMVRLLNSTAIHYTRVE